MLGIKQEDWVSIGKGTLVAGVGAAATYGLTALPTLQFGLVTPIVAAVCSVLANIIRKRLGL